MATVIELLEGRLAPEEMTDKAREILTTYLGGQDTVDMLFARHNEHASLGDLADWFGLTRQGVNERLHAAHARLKKVGLLPPAWDTHQ